MMAGLKCVIALTVSFTMLSTPVQAFPKGFPHRPGDATSQTLQIFSGCIDAGHTSGCCEGGLNACSVFTANGICYCDEGCHSVSGGCCPDISDIGCVATTCTAAGLSPGCCTAKCRISHGCYCDEVCLWFRDCCEDVPESLDCPSPALASQDQEDSRPMQVYPMENEDYARKMEWIVERLMAYTESFKRAGSQHTRPKYQYAGK